jgi:hypothetical protein
VDIPEQKETSRSGLMMSSFIKIHKGNKKSVHWIELTNLVSEDRKKKNS